MHRRNLILQRFGVMSFGLGYVEDGVWVDHAVAMARGEDLLANASAADRQALEAIHAWFTCCDGVAATAERSADSPDLVAIAGSASS